MVVVEQRLSQADAEQKPAAFGQFPSYRCKPIATNRIGPYNPPVFRNPWPLGSMVLDRDQIRSQPIWDGVFWRFGNAAAPDDRSDRKIRDVLEDNRFPC